VAVGMMTNDTVRDFELYGAIDHIPVLVARMRYEHDRSRML